VRRKEKVKMERGPHHDLSKEKDGNIGKCGKRGSDGSELGNVWS